MTTQRDSPKPDLDFVIDIRFRGVEAELYVTLDYLDVLDQQLPVITKRERDRLENNLKGLEGEEWFAELRWIDEYVDEVLPHLHFSPLLVQLWAVLESGIIEVSKELQRQGGHSLSIDDLRGSTLERAQKYYRDVLRFPLIEIEGAKERLELLSLARNAIAHSNGRIKAIKPAQFQKLVHWEKTRGGVFIGRDYVSFPLGFIREVALAGKNVLEDLVKRAKENHR
jgi:hypothetical protein